MLTQTCWIDRYWSYIYIVHSQQQNPIGGTKDMWDGILWLSLKMKPSFRFFLLFPKISHRKKGIKRFSGLLLVMVTYVNDCALSHCCTTCANSDFEMAPILMSVALQIGERDASVDMKKYRSFKRGEFYFLYSSIIYLWRCETDSFIIAILRWNISICQVVSSP